MPRISINDCRAQNRRAHLAFELAHLAQGLDRDRDRGRGQHHADERRLEHVVRIGRVIGKHQIAPDAADERHDNADDRNDKGRKTGGFELLEVGVQTGIEHQDDDADFGGLDQKIGLTDPAETARSHQHAGNQRADDPAACARARRSGRTPWWTA